MENFTVDIAKVSKYRHNSDDTQEIRHPHQGHENGDVYKADDRRNKEWIDEGDIMGEYTIDLGVLGDKPSSIVVVDNREIERAEMPEKDDGPEDFTLNLAKWMNGNESWKKPKPPVDEGNEKDANESPEPEHSHLDNHAGGIDEESLFEPAGSSTPASQKDHASHDPVECLSEGLRPPIFTRSNTQLQEQAAEEVFERISALQAEVERMREEEESRRVEQHDWEQENENLRMGIDEARRQLREWEDFRQRHEEIEDEDDVARSRDPGNLKRIDDEINDLHNQLKAADDRADQAQSELQASNQRQSDEIHRLSNQLKQQGQDAETERNKCLILAQEAAKLAESRQHNERTIRKLTDEATARSTELDHAYQQSRETRRIVDEVENENDRLTQENERQGRDILDVKQRLKGKVTEIQAAHATIAELREKLSTAQNSDDAHENIDAGIDRIFGEHGAQGEDEIASLKAQHAKDLETLRSALQNAIHARQKSETALKRSHKEQYFQLQEQITTLEDHLNAQEEAFSTHSIEDELRSAIRVLSVKLEKAYASTKAARAEAEAARQDALDSTEVNLTVNAELERRFEQAMETREREWMRRANLLFREREKMGKVLLQSWGRDEVGPAEKGERQAYRYKYVKGRF